MRPYTNRSAFTTRSAVVRRVPMAALEALKRPRAVTSPSATMLDRAWMSERASIVSSAVMGPVVVSAAMCAGPSTIRSEFDAKVAVPSMLREPETVAATRVALDATRGPANVAVAVGAVKRAVPILRLDADASFRKAAPVYRLLARMGPCASREPVAETWTMPESTASLMLATPSTTRLLATCASSEVRSPVLIWARSTLSRLRVVTLRLPMEA